MYMHDAVRHMKSGLPVLEDRFQEPEGWRWHQFTRNNRTLRFGSAFPKDSIPDAIVVCLPGLSEFGEKYFETARWCLSQNLAFWVLDWHGQGKSTRYLKNPHKRHAVNFQEDVDDLHYFFMEYVKHASVHPDKGRIPPVMLAHSMGGNIGLRYLQQHPGIFECAAFTAPMFGMKVFEKVPLSLHLLATSFARIFADKLYAPGGGDWSENTRNNPSHDYFSSDPARSALHNHWCLSDPELQSGFVTYGWVHRAAMSCAGIRKKSFLESIQTPCLIASAGTEMFVNNNAIRHVGTQLAHSEMLEYADAKHEILMEKDSIRNDFLDHFYKLVKESIIDRPETLKPF